jgi:hypothetical protein
MMPFSVVSYIMGPDMIESVYFWSVSGVVKVCHFFLTATLSWGILYIMTRRASLHRSSRLCHLRCCSMSLTLDVFRCLLVTYLAALHWTISIKCQIQDRDPIQNRHTLVMVWLIICMPFFNGGWSDDQVATQETKSLIGFTTDVVDVVFPYEFLADGSSQIFCLVNWFSDMTVKAIIEFHWCFIPWNGEHVTFIWVESHLP